MAEEPAVEPIWCNSCFSETDHDVVHREATVATQADGSRSPAVNTVLRCRGCRSFVLRQQTPPPDIATEGGGESDRVTETAYQPPRLWRRPPEWLAKLEEYSVPSSKPDRPLPIVASNHPVICWSMWLRSWKT
jgi:hypothetical protein